MTYFNHFFLFRFYLCICRKSMHWIALTRFGSFVYFTCSRSTRGTSLVQRITFGNCSLCTASFGRCKSCSIQHYRRIETHRLVEPSCWKRTGNLYDHKITTDKKIEKNHLCMRVRTQSTFNEDRLFSNGYEFHSISVGFFTSCTFWDIKRMPRPITTIGRVFFLVRWNLMLDLTFVIFLADLQKISVNLNKFTEYHAKYHIALGYLSNLELKCDIFIYFDCKTFENIRGMSPVK